MKFEMKRVLIACEESGQVTGRMRALGLDAWSCDILPTRGDPNFHLQEDIINVLNDGWDAVIAFPPCTHLAVSGARWFPEKIRDGRQQLGIDFFMLFANLSCPYAIENPVGIMSTRWRKPDQIIQPFQFGDSFKKTTCLWLSGLPKLRHTKLVGEGEKVRTKKGSLKPKWYHDSFSLPPEERAKVRSQTFPGIADAMADQWGNHILAL